LAHHHHQVTDNIRTAFFINLVFSILEILGGVYTNSLAIISDALHDLGDSLSLAVAWYFEKISGKKNDHNYSFGYKRFTVLGAIINAIILVAGSVVIIIEAIPRLFNPEEVNAKGMIILAVLGIVFNGAAILKLKGNHQSLNSRMVMLHLMEDVLGWVAVLIGSIVLLFTNLPIIDPILSLIVTLFILYNVFKNLKESVKIILQAIPKEMNLQLIEQQILSIEFIDKVHNLHIWTMDGEYHVLSVHLVINKNFTIDEVANIKQQVRAKLGDEKIKHFTIEVECADKDCSNIDVK